MSSADRAAYSQAVVLLEPTGTALAFAASEYANAVKRRGGVSFSQVADYYLKRNPVHLKPKMVHEVVEEMLKLKRSDSLSRRSRLQCTDPPTDFRACPLNKST